MRVSRGELRQIIKEEIQESVGSSYARMRSAQEFAASLVQLEKVMKHLLHQKQSSKPGTEEYDKAKEQLARLAAVANEYAYIGER
jgi:hypothetical protein